MQCDIPTGLVSTGAKKERSSFGPVLQAVPWEGIIGFGLGVKQPDLHFYPSCVGCALSILIIEVGGSFGSEFGESMSERILWSQLMLQL